MQAVGNGLQQHPQQQIPLAPGGGRGTEEDAGEFVNPIDMAEHKPHPSRSDHAHNHHVHRQLNTEGQGVGEPATPPQLYEEGQYSNSLSKNNQDLFLHAHFSSATPTASQSISSNSSGAYPRSNKDISSSSQHHHHHVHAPTESWPGPVGEVVAQHDHVPITGSNFIPMLTQIPPVTAPQHATPPSSTHSQRRHHTPILEYPAHPMDTTSQQDPAVSLHEITQVTNSVHAPISSLTPLPNDVVGEEYGGVAMYNMATNAAPYNKERNKSR